MAEVIKSLEKDCIKIGLSVDEFWTLDFDDIRTYFSAFADKERDKLKLQASLIFKSAGLTAQYISLMFGNREQPQIDKIFPGLFDEEVADYKAQQFSIQMQEYARRFNAQRKKGEENGK